MKVGGSGTAPRVFDVQESHIFYLLSSISQANNPVNPIWLIPELDAQDGKI